METFDELQNKALAHLGGCYVTVGVFDGFHLGHQALIRTTVQKARRQNSKAVMVTFSPRPLVVLQKINTGDLFTPEQKKRAAQEMTLDALVVQTFDERFATVSKESFLEEHLSKYLNLQGIVVGDDFCFGKNREGSIQDLETWTKSKNIYFHALQKIHESAETESLPLGSSLLRKELATTGDFRRINQALGRPYLLEGRVEPGAQRGRLLGIPTLNLGRVTQIIPKPGVYCGFITANPQAPLLRLDPEALPAVINVGFRPTFENTSRLSIEAHGLTSSVYPTYGDPAGIYFLHRLRDEQKFASKEDLQAQIASDIALARAHITSLIQQRIPQV